MGKQDKYTQIKRIWNFLENHPEGLTTMEASDKLRITNLPRRISEMIVLGYKISKTWETYVNEFGTHERIMRYKAVA